MSRLLLTLLLLLPVALTAQEPYAVGDEPVDHAVQHWINPPAWDGFSELRGDVIVFKKWGCT
ncbi:MAG: hypothetical protein M5U25_09785 [Planctomycetota bacterium]|nr:hypothetical protein [Planctomycetota bacterium]